MRNGASKLIGNIVITRAGGFLLLGGLICVAIVCVYAFALVIVRRLIRLMPGSPEHTLP
jgi:drug/metabolite transporter (DMT)-like permease